MNLVSIVICKNVSFINWFSTHLLVRIHFTIQSNGLKVKCCQSFFEIRFHKIIILQKIWNQLFFPTIYTRFSFLLHISNLKYFRILWNCCWSIFVRRCLYFVVCNNKNLYKSIVESLSILHDAKYYLFLHYFKEKTRTMCVVCQREENLNHTMQWKIWSFD